MTISSHIRRRLQMSDYIRRSPQSLAGPSSVKGSLPHKEWYHFCVFQPGLDLFLNFSLSDGIQAGDGESIESARVTALALNDGRWSGDMQLAPHPKFSGGAIDLDFNIGSVTFQDGVYHVRTNMPNFCCELEFEPQTSPGFTDSIPIEGGTSIKWVVIPRMRASGWAEIDGCHALIDGAPAYHDHNWGQFGWGDDFAWEWAIVLPECTAQSPWAVVYTRLSDRGRLNTFSEGLLVWRGEQHYKAFRSDAITVAPNGLKTVARPFVLPSVMGLLKQGSSVDVPSKLGITAQSDLDHLEVDISTRDYGHILVPNDDIDLSTTVLTEVASSARVSGSIRGEEIDFSGPCVLELIHGE